MGWLSDQFLPLSCTGGSKDQVFGLSSTLVSITCTTLLGGYLNLSCCVQFITGWISDFSNKATRQHRCTIEGYGAGISLWMERRRGWNTVPSRSKGYVAFGLATRWLMRRARGRWERAIYTQTHNPDKKFSAIATRESAFHANSSINSRGWTINTEECVYLPSHGGEAEKLRLTSALPIYPSAQFVWPEFHVLGGLHRHNLREPRFDDLMQCKVGPVHSSLDMHIIVLFTTRFAGREGRG